MSLISESQALAADLYLIGVELGANEHSVSVTVPGSLIQDPDTGLAQRLAETTTNFPTALVERVGLERAAKSGGALDEGDLILSQIPRSPANDPLVIRPDGVWTVIGPGITGEGSFRLKSARPKLLEWVITVTRAGV
jgi:hypothetical protein